MLHGVFVMRLIRLLTLAVIFNFAALASLAISPAQSAPIAASSVAAQVAATSRIERTRLYCFNRYTGQFLHWGPCGGYRTYYYHRPYRRHYYYHRPRWHRHYYYY
jgi:hypothetical protein